MSIGERIKEARKGKHLTQQGLADLIGIKQNSIALIESGKRNASDQVIRSVCRELNVSEDWLRYGKGDPDAPDEFEALAARYSQMSEEAKAFVKKLITLPAADQDKIMDFLRSVVADFPPKEETSAAPDDEDPEEAYKKTFGFVSNEESTALNSTSGTGSIGSHVAGNE